MDDPLDDENDEFLSDFTSETTFFDEEKLTTSSANDKVPKDIWDFTLYRTEGKVLIFGEWTARTTSYRYAVVGPDWPCVLVTYVIIVLPAILIYYYMTPYIPEKVIFDVLFAFCIFGLTAVVTADPGLVRKYHHARSRHWTYCDHCESYRPPGTVHCSTCQVCIAGYDHHCPWTGKCIGHGNIFFFKVFVYSLCSFIIFVLILGILYSADVKFDETWIQQEFMRFTKAS